MANIVVLILAAGSSSRMGRPKQLLKWNKTTLLGHTIRTAREINPIEVFVVLGAKYNLIKSEINQDGIQILNNEHWKRGLGNSIAFGVGQILKNDLNFNGILITLADQPLIDSTYLNSLIQEFEVGKSQIIASLYKNDKLGVPVLFDKFYIEELTKLDDDKGAKVLLHKYSNHISAINAKHIVSDIDTLEDYERLYNA